MLSITGFAGILLAPILVQPLPAATPVNGLALTAGVTAAATPAAAPEATPAQGEGTGKSPSASALGPHRAEYVLALGKARAWLDALEVDAEALQRSGVKGKKKLAEILAAYWDYYRFGEDASEKAGIMKRVQGLAAQTSRPGYHNLRTCPDAEFRQNSMSYMRVLRLMEEFGLDTAAYQEELKKAKPRLDAHLERRGPWQRSVFASYYDRFGLEKPPILRDAALSRGIVEERPALEKITLMAAYRITHQVFAAFDYGNRSSQESLDAEDLEYLRRILPAMAKRYTAGGEPDILAEVLSSMAYLDMKADPAYLSGIRHLLGSQNADGTWGDYPRERHGEFVDQKLYLHTTMVAVHALVTALR